VQITEKDAEERLDMAIGLFRMAVAEEDKLIDWYPAEQDDPRVKAVATDCCGNLDLLMETATNLGEIGNPKNKAFFQTRIFQIVSGKSCASRKRLPVRVGSSRESDSPAHPIPTSATHQSIPINPPE
jgi:hypothetical protein